MTAEPTDQALIEACQARRTEALAVLYDRYASRMLASALRVLKNRRDAEDLVHDVFVEVWQCAGNYDATRGTVISWILTRVRSRAIDRLRSLSRARKHQRAAQPLPLEAPSEAEDSRSRGFRYAIGQLQETHRTIVELSYYRGLTCTEIAVHCAIPVGTVKSRLSAALAALRNQLKDQLRDD